MIPANQEQFKITNINTITIPMQISENNYSNNPIAFRVRYILVEHYPEKPELMKYARR